MQCEKESVPDTSLEDDFRWYLEKESSPNDDEKVIALTIVEEIERSQLEEAVQKQLISSILMKKLNMTQYAIDSVFALKEEHELSECIVAVEAVGGDLQRAQDYFKECATCYTKFGMHKLVTLFTCQCLVCTECFTVHFTTLAQTTSCMYKFSCPVCNEPVLENSPPEEFQTYFSFLGMILKNYLTEKDFELYDQKLASWELMADEYFRWCVHGCRSGFINDRGTRKIQCPECMQYQCFNCQKPWSVQHEKLTCEEFLVWKKAHDPEYQQSSQIAQLKESGITCPKCKMHYELAKGGCMHFKCPRCLNEFCCGCNLPFRRYPRCQQSPSCKGKGLHAHHPRDCLYYLRDEECYALQRLLQINSIDYSQATNTAGTSEGPSKCPVKEQHEGPNGLEDAICGKPLIGQCGLCENHYKEYLVGLINQGNIDPVDVFGLESLQAILRRNDKTIPIQDEDETHSAYCARLRQEIQQQLPLRQRNAQGVCV